MIYHWLYPLADTFGARNVVRYITFRTAAATLTALFISFIVGPWLIRRLAKLRVDNRFAKSVPTMRPRKERPRWVAS